MHIHLINPNTSKNMTESMAATAACYANKETVIMPVTAQMGPQTIESHFDEAMSIVAMADAIKAGEEMGADAYILACFGDPCIWAIREMTDKPVLGIAQASFMMASLVCKQFAVVTSLARTITIAEHLLHEYGMNKQCAGVLAVDLPVEAIDSDDSVQAVIKTACHARDNLRAGAIVLGCGGMSAQREYIETQVGIPVIDGVIAAVKLLEAMQGLGLKTSKVGDLAYPPAKVFTGSLSRFGQGNV